jgi:hypothetical protein
MNVILATSTETGKAISVELGVINKYIIPATMYAPRIVQIHA